MRLFLEAIYIIVITATSITMATTIMAAIIIIIFRKAITVLDIMTAINVTKYISIMIAIKARIVNKKCNYYKHYNGYTTVKVIITTSLIRATRVTIV